MSENSESAENLPQFTTESFIPDIASLGKDEANMELYIHTYLDKSNSEGKANLKSVIDRLFKIHLALEGKRADYPRDEVFLAELVKLGMVGTPESPSEDERMALDKGWNKLIFLLNQAGGEPGRNLWKSMGPAINDMEFSEENYKNLYPIPESEPVDETPVPPELDDAEPDPAPVPPEPAPEVGSDPILVEGAQAEEGEGTDVPEPDVPQVDAEGETAGETSGPDEPSEPTPPPSKPTEPGPPPSSGPEPKKKPDSEAKSDADDGPTPSESGGFAAAAPEAEQVPLTIDAFTDGMDQVMRASEENRQAAFFELMGMVSPENFKELFKLLDFPLAQIDQSRKSGTSQMKQRVLGLLGFKKAPTFEVFQKRYTDVVDLIVAVSSDKKSNRTLELFSKALYPVLIITVDNEKLDQARSGVSSYEQLKALYSSSGSDQYNQYFHGISESETDSGTPENERQTSLKEGIKEVMNGSVWKQRKAMLALLSPLEGSDLKSIFPNLLSASFKAKEARKTPGSAVLQSEILASLGLDSNSSSKDILTRLRDVDYVLQNVLRKDEVAAARSLRMALHNAMLCVVPEDMMNKLKENAPASTWAADQVRNLRFINGLPWRDKSQCEAFFSMGEEDDDPETDGEKKERQAKMGTLARAKEFFSSKEGEGLGKKALRGYAALSLAEWGVRSGLTAMKTGWEFTKRGARTTVNVMTKPFRQAGERFGQGWNYVEAPSRVTLPDDSAWYQRLGNSSWFTAKRLVKGTAALGLGLTLGTAGVAEGAVYSVPEAIGVKLEDQASPEEPKKEEIMAAIEGKVSDETKKEIEEAGEVGAMVEMAAAALGENGIQILKDAGVIVDGKSRSFADRISMDRESGMLAMGAAVLGGTKEAVVDNTFKAAKLEGTRDVAVKAGKVVLGGGFNIPTANELLAFAGDVKEIAPGFQKALKEASKDPKRSTFDRYLYALANLPKDQQLKVTRGFVNTFDLDEGDSKWRKGLWTVMPEALDMYSNLKYADRNYKPNYERGVGVTIAGLSQERLATYMGDSETVEKLFENHELVMSTSAEYYQGLIKNVRDKEAKVGRQHQLRAVASALQKFLGVKKIRAASASRYEGRIAPAITKLGKLKTKLVGEGADKNKAAIEDVDFIIALYEKITNEVFKKAALMELLEDPSKVRVGT